MKSMRIFLIVLALAFFAKASYAEIVYLKSGETVEGKILEKKKNGNVVLDVGGVPIEFFYDEIIGVKEKKYGEIAEKMYLMAHRSPSEVVNDYCNAMIEGDIEKAYKELTRKKYTEVKDIKLVLTDRNKGDGQDLKKFRIVKEDVQGDKATVKVAFDLNNRRFEEDFMLVKQGNDWKIYDYIYSNRSRYFIKDDLSKESLAGVSGDVILPDITKKGKLSVFFNQCDENGNLKGRSYFFDKSVSEDGLKGPIKVPYSIDNLMPGTYKGFAVWDIAEPFWDETANLKDSFALNGDFVGKTDLIRLSPNENLKGVDFKLKVIREHRRPVLKR